MRFRERPEEPWDSFLKALDATVTGMVRLDCIGGFVMTQLYGMQRPTLDVDVIELAPREIGAALLQIAARGGSLAKQHSIYIDRVAVASIPEDYESRLIEMFPGAYGNLRLMAVDPYDLALSKLERNTRKDREDVKFLAHEVPLDLQTLQDRYRTEMRWQLGVPEREDLTLRLWIEMIEEDRTVR
jgi:hypothetical protein